MKTGERGFTLIEMLLVIAIIGVLSSALIFSYGRVVKSAARAKAVELVSNARTAFEELRRNKEGWPQSILKARQENGYYVMDEDVAKTFAMNGLLNVDCKVGSKRSECKLRGKDRCGIVSPWAQDALASKDRSLSGSALLSTSVPTGGTMRDHLLYFAVDRDEDGFVKRDEGAPVEAVRASVIVWCAGADGKISGSPGPGSTTGEDRDNVYSWEKAQEDGQ